MTEADWRMKAMADFFGAKFVRVDEDGEPMTTNDATREALAQELTQAQHDAWPGVDADFIVNTEAIMPIIDRLLADRAVPEPDADAIEAAAKAIRATADAFFEGPEVDQITSVKSAKQAFERLYLDQARAALQAAAGKEAK